MTSRMPSDHISCCSQKKKSGLIGVGTLLLGCNPNFHRQAASTVATVDVSYSGVSADPGRHGQGPSRCFPSSYYELPRSEADSACEEKLLPVAGGGLGGSCVSGAAGRLETAWGLE